MSVQKIAVELIIPTPDNPRRMSPTDPALQELAESIKASGQLQAGVGRPHPTKPGHIDLRAGCRRHAACVLAGLPTMDVNVIEMDDAAAMRATVLENLQREDLTPLEEARGVAGLAAVGQDVETIAAEMGKSAAWVRRRAQLTKLVPDWQELAEQHHIPAAHLELIARYDEATQGELYRELSNDWQLDQMLKPSGLAVLKELLADRMRELRLAPWKLDDETLAPAAGACAGCAKRTDCQADLFAEFAGGAKPDARCLDTACWDTKLASHNERAEAKLRQKHPDLVTVTTEYDPPAGPAIGRMGWDLATKGDRNSVPALMLDGEKAGKLVHVVLRGRGAQKAKAATAKAAGQPAKSMEERREGLENRRKAMAIDHLRDAIDRCKPPKVWKVMDALRALVIFGTDGRADHVDAASWKGLDRLEAVSAGEVITSALDCLRPVLSRRLVIYTPGAAPTVWADAEEIAALLAIDLAALKAQADSDIPEPKSWAKIK